MAFKHEIYDLVLQECADAFGVTLEELNVRKPPRYVVRARQTAWYILRQRGWSYQMIAEVSGYDRTTVNRCIAVVDEALLIGATTARLLPRFI